MKASSSDGSRYWKQIWDDATNEVASAYAEIEKSISKLFDENAKKSTADQEWLASSKAKINEAKVVVQEIMTALQQKNIDKVDELFAERLEPFQEQFGEMINQLIVGKIAEVEKEYIRAENRYKAAQMAFIITIFIGVSIGLAVGFLLMRSINDPLVRITQAINVMKQGDLSFGENSTYRQSR